jgi:predicted membrane chloride channel (bestrophin family)
MSGILCTQLRIIKLQIAYVHALRCQLHGFPPWDDLKRLLYIEYVEELKQCPEPGRRNNLSPRTATEMAGLENRQLRAKDLDTGVRSGSEASLDARARLIKRALKATLHVSGRSFRQK